MTIFLQDNNLVFDEIAFIGDEINDVKLLQSVGLSFAVGDAAKEAKESADIICKSNGGNGAFREATEILLKLNGKNVDDIINSYL